MEDKLTASILAIVEDFPQGAETEVICRRLGRSKQDLGDAFECLREAGSLIGFGGLWFTAQGWEASQRTFLQVLSDWHEKSPSESYARVDVILNLARLPWQGKALERMLSGLESEGRIQRDGDRLRLPNAAVRLTPRQQALLDRLKTEIEKVEINVANPRDLARFLGVPVQAVQEIIKLGRETGELIPIDDEIIYTPQQISQLQRQMKEAFGAVAFTASEFRDRFDSSRKYAIPLLEYFDRIGVTHRCDDKRVLIS